MDEQLRHVAPCWFLPLLPDIQQACRDHHLAYLYVIGSLLKADSFRPESDIDWVYAFDSEEVADDIYLDNLKQFWQKLERLTGREADLIHYPSLINPFFIEEIDETKQLIYDAKSEKISV